MMKRFNIWLIVLGFFLYTSGSLASSALIQIPLYSVPCGSNTESNTTNQQDATEEMIHDKQKELNDAIDDYKEALEKKKEMMQKLWTTTAHIEFLMKENQIMRKEMIKHWRDVKDTQASGQSL